MTGPDRSLDASPERSAFEAMAAADFDDVWRFVRRRCDSSEDADDVTAETFAVAWRRRGDLPADGARLWLFGVARRVLANHRRSLDRRERLHLRLVRAAPESTPEVWAEPDGSLWAAMRALSPEDRELLIMRAWDELPVGEMAVLLGCTPNAASLRLHRARGRLAAELDRKERDRAGQVMAEPTKAKEEPSG